MEHRVPHAVLSDGEVDCEVDRRLVPCDPTTGGRSCHVQWKGLPPEETERLTASKLKNMTDVVQDHFELKELSNKGRPAARVV